jgi:cell wall-associated NlpC family hydrolase
MPSLMRRFLTLTGLLFVLLWTVVQTGRAHAATLTVRASKVVKVALKERGIRYSWGGTSPRSGFDCSGFTRWVYAHVGVSLPHSSYAQFGMGRRVGLRALKPGDLLFFNGVGHVGIYIGHGRFVHAPHSGTVVQVTPLSEYRNSIDGARRPF